MDEKWKYQNSGAYKREGNPNYRGGQEIPCDYCGKPIYCTPWKLKKTKNHFCSKQCHDDFRRKPKTRTPLSEMRGPKHGRWAGTRYCKICGKEIFDRQRRKTLICSKECGAVAKSKAQGGENHPSWKGGKITLECWQCGKNFLVSPGKIDKAHYCSNECRHIGKRNRVTLNCEHCNKEFIAAYQRVRDENPRYCSISCYRSAIGKTSLESRIITALNALGLKYIDEYKPKKTRWSIDFYLPDFSLFIEADGEFWHHSEWAKNNGVDKRDRRKDKWARDNGYKMIRIRESETWTLDTVDIIKLRFQELELII